MTRLEEYRLQKEKERIREENRGKRRALAAVILMAIIVLGGLLYYFCFVGAWSYYDGGGESCELEQKNKSAFELNMSDSHILKNYGNYSLMCGKNDISAYDKNGNRKWSVNISVKEPIVDICEKYILVADRKGKSVYIIRNGKLILSYETQYNITTARVNKYGSFVTVTDEDGYKSLVKLIDSAGDELFTWHSAGAYVVDAAVAKNESTLMIAAVNTELQGDGKIKYASEMKLFDIDKAVEKASVDFADNILTNVFAVSDGYIVLNANTIVKYDSSGNEKKRININGNCAKIAFDGKNTAITYTDESYKNHIAYYDSSLNVKADKELFDKRIQSLDICEGVIAYLCDGNVYLCKSNLDVRYKIKTEKLYKNIALFCRGKRVMLTNEMSAATCVAK